jgi:uncharacterized protein YoxC
VIDPIFWLGLSILLVAVSLTAVLMATLPAMRELARAARSAEKLFDTLSRELPPTLDSIRLTSQEINQLKGDVSEGVQSTSSVVQQVDESLSGAKKQAQQAKTISRSLLAGAKAAWRSFQQSDQKAGRRSPHPRQDERPLPDWQTEGWTEKAVETDHDEAELEAELEAESLLEAKLEAKLEANDASKTEINKTETRQKQIRGN